MVQPSLLLGSVPHFGTAPKGPRVGQSNSHSFFFPKAFLAVLRDAGDGIWVSHLQRPLPGPWVTFASSILSRLWIQGCLWPVLPPSLLMSWDQPDVPAASLCDVSCR